MTAKTGVLPLASSSSGGTVSSFSFTNLNGFTGTVTNSTTTPTLAVGTSVTGILYGDGTGVAAAVAANFPTLNQNTTGNANTATYATSANLSNAANTLSTPRAIYGNNFDGSAALTQVIAGTYGGTGVNNGASLLTYAANITFSGAFAFTGTLTNTTTVTFPVTGTLATLAGSETLTNKTLTNPTVNNYTEGVVAIGNSSTAQTISLTNGTFQTVTMTGNCTFTMPTAASGKSFLLLVNTGAGSFTGTFTSVKWPGNTVPTLTATASRWDMLSFASDGTNWYGNFAQAYQ